MSAGSEGQGVGTYVDTDRYGELIQRADQGDKYALRDLFGHASAWARGGERPIPEPLGTWIADRLLDVARAIDARKDADIGGRHKGGGREMEAALAVALRVRRAGKAGRTPNPRTRAAEIMRAQEVLHFMVYENMLPAQAIERAVKYDQERLGGKAQATVKKYEAAWAKHGAAVMKEAGVEFKDPERQQRMHRIK